MRMRGARFFSAVALAGLASLVGSPAVALAGADDPDSERGATERVAPPPEPPSPPDAAGSDAASTTDLALTPPGTRGAFPWASLGSSDYWLVRDVVDRAAVSREVTDISFRSRKAVFDFLIANLDFAADVARILRQGKYRVRRAGDGYEADDGHGAHGTLRPVVADGDRRVFYLAGSYDAPLLPSLEVRGVLQVDAEHSEGIDGVTYCSLHLAGHVRFDSRLVTTLAAVARQYSSEQLGRQLQRFFRHVAVVSRRAYDDPEGLADDLAGRPELSAERVAEFREVLLADRAPVWSETQRYELVGPLAPAAAGP